MAKKKCEKCTRCSMKEIDVFVFYKPGTCQCLTKAAQYFLRVHNLVEYIEQEGIGRMFFYYCGCFQVRKDQFDSYSNEKSYQHPECDKEYHTKNFLVKS